jgi:steroid delta-isomerase
LTVDDAEVRALLERYAAAWAARDRAGWLATFAADATQEDPVGGGVRTGHQEIGGFWDRAFAGYDTIEIRPRRIHLSGGEAAMEWTITTTEAGTVRTFDGVDAFTFTGDRIASVRAWWQHD